uniref:Uncharacterized protein n=1 Tax=Aegilops tauschii subsp. strangulata TaxID=200361 RepID=A0A453GUA3_AEGTS
FHIIATGRSRRAAWLHVACLLKIIEERILVSIKRLHTHKAPCRVCSPGEYLSCDMLWGPAAILGRLFIVSECP